MNYGGIIKNARKSKKLTQGELSNIVGCTRTTICDWETEKYPPTDANNISALEQALEFQSGYLYALLFSNPTPPPRRTRGRPKGAATRIAAGII